MGALFVTGGAHADGTDGTWSHGIVVLLMCVCIGAEWDSHMFVVVDATALDEIAWRVIRRHRVGVRECVLPKDGILGETNDHDPWEKLEWHIVVCRTDGVFGGANVSLNVGDMFIGPTEVEVVAWQ